MTVRSLPAEPTSHADETPGAPLVGRHPGGVQLARRLLGTSVVNDTTANQLGGDGGTCADDVETASTWACEVCGGRAEHPFELTVDGAVHVFDCFACAIAALAPRCAGCAAPILGHPVEDEGEMLCSWTCLVGRASCAPSLGAEHRGAREGAST